MSSWAEAASRPWEIIRQGCRSFSGGCRAGAVAMLVGLGTAGCEGGSPGGAEDANEPIVLEASDVRIIASSDLIASVIDLVALPSGDVWVQNSGEPLFLGFDSDGTTIGSHGRLGGGPDEFGAPAGFIVLGSDPEAWVFDFGRHALIEVSADGAGSVIALPRDSIPEGTVMGTNPFLSRVRVERLGNELILPRRSGQIDPDVFGYWMGILLADLVAYGPDPSSARTVVELRSVVENPREHFEMGDVPLPFPLWFRLWGACGDGAIRVHDRFRNEIRGFAPDGTELPPTLLPPPSLTDVSRRDFARAIIEMPVVEQMGAVPSGGVQISSEDSARVISEVLPRLNATPEQLANLLPRYVDYHCDEGGTQWIQPFDIERPGSLMGGLRGGRTWLRITPDGTTRQVRLPHRFDLYRITRDRIWGVLRDELDVASIAWIELPEIR